MYCIHNITQGSVWFLKSNRQRAPEIIYPDSDGQPVANNTKQFRWIVVIQQNLDWLFADFSNVFVAGDLFWYPVEVCCENRQCALR